MESPWGLADFYTIDDIAKYTSDIKKFFLDERRFFKELFNSNKKIIAKQLTYYIFLFTLIAFIVQGLNYLVIKTILVQFFAQLLIDIIPVATALYLTTTIFKINFSFGESFVEIAIALLCTYIFCGSIVIIASIAFEGTSNIRRDKLILSLSLVLFFIYRQILIGKIFLKGNKQLFVFFIFGLMVNNILLFTIYLSSNESMKTYSGIKPFIATENFNILFFKDDIAIEWEECEKSSGSNDYSKMPVSKVDHIDREGNIYSCFIFDRVINSSESEFSSIYRNYELSKILLASTQEHLDSLNKNIPNLKYETNVKYFKLKRNLYINIVRSLNNFPEKEFSSFSFAEKAAKAKTVAVEPIGALIADYYDQMRSLQNEFSDNLNFAYKPVMLYYKFYFFPVLFTF